jgi:hypothetical protein
MEAGSVMSVLSRIKNVLAGGGSPPPVRHDHDGPVEHASRHDRRAAGRERHHETGGPAWEESDRIEEPEGADTGNADRAPEILGG